MKIEISKAEQEEARLTAYVLGELDDEARAEVDQLIESSAETRATLDEIRSTESGNSIRLVSGDDIPLSRSFRDAFKARLIGPEI